jgi:hypothetical protein
MSAKNLRQVLDLFDQATGPPAAERAAFLEALCARDPELYAEVTQLLDCDSALTGPEDEAAFLNSPVVRPPGAAEAVPARIGRYRIIGVVGEGGMGTVYEAEQDSPHRTVALKVIRPGLLAAAPLLRFAQEVEILGRLLHPGIAQIYDAGLA